MAMIVINQKMFGYRIKRLSCGHCFHRRCIDNVAKCPICQSAVLTDEELKFLKLPHVTRDDISALKHDRAMIILKEAVKRNNESMIDGITTRFDPSEVILQFLDSGNDVTKLLRSKSINWHSGKVNKIYPQINEVL